MSSSLLGSKSLSFWSEFILNYFCEVTKSQLDVPGHSWVKVYLKDEVLLDQIEIFALLAGKDHFCMRRIGL